MKRLSLFVFLLGILSACTASVRAAGLRASATVSPFPVESAVVTPLTDTLTAAPAETPGRPERPSKNRRHIPAADTAEPHGRIPALTLFEADIELDSLLLRAADTLPQAAPDTILPLDETLNRFSHDRSLDTLLWTRLVYYRQHPTQGYSVLFFSASGNHSGAAAEQAEEFFQFLYPDTPTYLSYDAPYYKLKAGNFRTRLEASAFLAQIQNDYPNAFVVRDVLDIKHLLLMDEPEPTTAEPENEAGTETSDETEAPSDATDSVIGQD